MWCTCPADSIEAADDVCIQCTGEGEVPNEEQTACVGKELSKKLYSVSMFHIFENMKKNDDFFKTEE